MRQKLMKSALIVGGLLLASMVLPVAVSSASAATQVHVNVNIGAPPPVIVQAPPTMVYLAEPAVYAAVGVPYDIFFISGRYYYLRGNDWFWAAGYGGPWTYVTISRLPPGLRKYKVERLRDYREREYVVYRQQGPSFKGKHFEAEEHEHGKGHGNDNDQGHGNSGHGKKDK